MKTYSDFRMMSKNQAYWERNQLVAALSKVFPASLGKHPASDKTWDKEWRNIVYITIPVAWYHMMPMAKWPVARPKQLSWHIHDEEMVYFKHLKKGTEKWDGHTTDEKYDRLANLMIEEPSKWYEFWK